MKNIRRAALVAAMVSAAVAAGGCATHHGTVRAGAAAPVAAPDLVFASSAAGSGLYEVEVSRLAADRALNAQVRNYAQMLVQHHAIANSELMALARAKGMALPAGIPAPLQEKVAQLARLNGGAFDREYIRVAGVQDHQANIGLFEQGSRSVADRDLKAWIDKTLPVLRQHLQGAQNLAGTLAG